MGTSCQRLPTAGETVLIKGLVSSPALNEKRCKIVRYVEKSHRYCIKLRSDDGTIRKVEIKPQNISLLPSKKTDAGSSIRGNDAYYFCGDWDVAHVFIPCHVEDERRCEQFEQCCESLIHQNGSCRIFVGVSGPAEMRQLAIASLRKAAVSSGSADRVCSQKEFACGKGPQLPWTPSRQTLGSAKGKGLYRFETQHVKRWIWDALWKFAAISIFCFVM